MHSQTPPRNTQGNSPAPCFRAASANEPPAERLPRAKGEWQEVQQSARQHVASQLLQQNEATSLDRNEFAPALVEAAVILRRHVVDALGWPPAGHSFTDMHDWGDMLIQTGFAEPVMDMETITLSFATPERLLQELRELGRNLHPQRFAGLRGQQWRDRLLHAVDQHLRLPDGQLGISFEIVYGHAFKAAPRSARQWKKNRADLR